MTINHQLPQPSTHKCLSIRQPWAWLIIHAGKDIENREWRSAFTGLCLIHASKTMTRGDYDACALFLASIDAPIELPAPADLLRGGIIGSVYIYGCVTQSHSPWFCGPYGFQLSDPEPFPFSPFPGRLKFFPVDPAVLDGSLAIDYRRSAMLGKGPA